MMQFLLQIGLIGLSIAAVVTVIQPMYAEIEEIQTETEQYEIALDSAQKTNQRVKDLRDEVDRLTQLERYRIGLLVQDVLDPVSLAYDIERLIESQGVFLNSIAIAAPQQIQNNSISVGETPTDDVFTEVTEVGETLIAQDISLSVSATYAQFKTLLRNLESSALLLDVTDVAFQSVDSDINTYSLVVRAYGYTTSSGISTSN